MKAAGSLVPTHFHNAVYTGGEGEGRGQRGEFLLSPVFFFLSQREMLSLPGRRTAGEEKMASLLVAAGAYRLFFSLSLTVTSTLCSYKFKTEKHTGSCVTRC